MFPCPSCEKRLGSHSALLAHDEAVHLKLKDIKCPSCEFMMSTKASLRSHLLKKHNISEQKFSCQLCGKKFISSSAMSVHNKSVHQKLKDVKCTHCEFTTSTKGTLKSHVLSKHTRDDSDKLKNSHCEYRTYEKTYLSIREKSVHLKLKDIKCPNCEFITSTKQNLRMHILNKHTSGQRYKCQ